MQYVDVNGITDTEGYEKTKGPCPATFGSECPFHVSKVAIYKSGNVSSGIGYKRGSSEQCQNRNNQKRDERVE